MSSSHTELLLLHKFRWFMATIVNVTIFLAIVIMENFALVPTTVSVVVENVYVSPNGTAQVFCLEDRYKKLSIQKLNRHKKWKIYY